MVKAGSHVGLDTSGRGTWPCPIFCNTVQLLFPVSLVLRGFEEEELTHFRKVESPGHRAGMVVCDEIDSYVFQSLVSKNRINQAKFVRL